MANAELGHKQRCTSCGIKFYDLNKKPIICPSCNTEFDPESLLKSRRGRGSAKAEEKAASADTDDTDATAATDSTDVTDPVKIIPTNLTLSIEIVGSSSQNPNGDGSGLVRFRATANDAVNFSFRFGTGDSEESASGVVEYTYSDVGTNPYNVNVLAYSSTNDFASTSQTISVFVLPALDPDITQVLTGGTEKSWKVNAAYDAHFSNGDKQFKYPTWWEASSFSKSNSGFSILTS